MANDQTQSDWGATLTRDGVRFRLWAPSVDWVELIHRTGDAWSEQPMFAAGGGWWEFEVPGAGAGCRYRYRVGGKLEVPDPASRFQPDDCQGDSLVVDLGGYAWQAEGWRGRPWHEAVVYELHVGTFTPEGTYRSVIARLDELVELGVTAIELMPLADFPGRWNWGYDGVLPFAPDSSYGTPGDLKALVDAAHQRKLMVLLDVVYNHFGPEGNYIGQYAAPFFTHRHQTPWGDAINFDTGPERLWVRRFFIDNALYWLEEYRFDGLRLDAVHAISDDSDEHVLVELAREVATGPGAERHVHLVLENDGNDAHWLDGATPGGYRAQWNDDYHHVLHVALTGEHDSYYGDYADEVMVRVARTLAEGFDYQGEQSAHRGRPRGEPSAHLLPTAFLAFLQNHDQIGNRALGERLHELTTAEALRAATEILLLGPMPPLLFMGQEWCASSRFPYFCDYQGELAEAIVQGRLREFGQFDAFRDPAARQRIPNPVSPETFRLAKLSWDERQREPHRQWLELFRELLALRHRHVVPLLSDPPEREAEHEMRGAHGFMITWHLAGGVRYRLLANLGDKPVEHTDELPGRQIYASRDAAAEPGMLAPWSVLFHLETSGA